MYGSRRRELKYRVALLAECPTEIESCLPRLSLFDPVKLSFLSVQWHSFDKWSKNYSILCPSSILVKANRPFQGSCEHLSKFLKDSMSLHANILRFV